VGRFSHNHGKCPLQSNVHFLNTRIVRMAVRAAEMKAREKCSPAIRSGRSSKAVRDQQGSRSRRLAEEIEGPAGKSTRLAAKVYSQFVVRDRERTWSRCTFGNISERLCLSKRAPRVRLLSVSWLGWFDRYSLSPDSPQDVVSKLLKPPNKVSRPLWRNWPKSKSVCGLCIGP